MNNKEIYIQEAEKKHAAELIEYTKKVGDETDFLTFQGSEFNKTIEEEQAIIEQHKLAKNRIFILAILNNEIIGILNVNSSQKKRLKHVGEFGISVLKAHWSKGVGGLLMKYMIDWAKESGIIRKLNLKVLVANDAAIKLYKKFGFEVEGLIKRDFYIKNKFQDTLIMGLIID